MKEKTSPGIKPTGRQTGQIQSPEKTFTQSEVNELMRKRVERSHNAFFKRYGVKDLEELDNLMSSAQSYEPTKQMYDESLQKYNDLETQHKDLTKRYGYRVHNINPDKYTDIETYFKGKGIDIDENSLLAELKTHKDWVSKPVTIQSMGSDVTTPPSVDEAAVASQIFGVDLTN